MELELIEGIFARIGEIYSERSTATTLPTTNTSTTHTHSKTKDDEEKMQFLKCRDKFLQERSQILKHDVYRVKASMDSGYSSILPSGHCSQQGSKSPSPVPPEICPSTKPSSDNRPRKWLICQTGVVAVRVLPKASPAVKTHSKLCGESSDTPNNSSLGGQHPVQPVQTLSSPSTLDTDVITPAQVPKPVQKSRFQVSWVNPSNNTSVGTNIGRSQEDVPAQDPQANGTAVRGASTPCSARSFNSNNDATGSSRPKVRPLQAMQPEINLDKLRHSLRLEESGSSAASAACAANAAATTDNSVTKQNTHTSTDNTDTVTVELEDTQEILEVEAKYLEEASSSDVSVTDLSQLQVISESEVLATISSRFYQGEYQTRLGSSLVSVNPMRRTDSGCGRTARKRRGRAGGSEELVNLTEQVYRKAMLTGRTQSLVMMGRSGAGKSCNLKHALAYLIETTQHITQSKLNVEKMHAIDCLMESFCSTRTSLNTHATRLVQLTELQFDKDGWLSAGSVEMALPDTNRLLRSGRLSGEPTFPIMYQVQAALGKSNLFLPPRMLTNNSFFTPLQEEVEIVTALEDWGRVCGAMELLEFSQEEQDSFWIILAAITNLGHIAQCLESCDSVDEVCMEKVAKLLGVKPDDLKMVFSRPNTPQTISPASSIAASSTSSRTCSPAPSPTSPIGYPSLISSMPDLTCLAVENVKRLAVNLYAELLSRLVANVNRSIRTTESRQSARATILLFDAPGFQNPSTATGEKPAAGFVDLCYNYLQEKLLQLFNTSTIDPLAQGKQAYKMLFTKRGNPNPILNVLEKQNQRSTINKSSSRGGVDRASKRVRFQNTSPGLFTLLHRAANCPWSDDHVFLQRLIAHWGSSCNGSLLERVEDSEFVLRHSLGTNPVRYSVKGWRQISYSMGRTNLALELLRKSSRPELAVSSRSLFCAGIGISDAPLTLCEVKARMSCLQVQVQVETLVRLLSQTEMSFVFCLLPHNLAGLCELFKKSPGRHLNQKLIRDQLRGYQFLDYLTATRCSQPCQVGQNGETEACPPEAADARHSPLRRCHKCVARTQENLATSSLAGELWHGLQVAVFNAVTNLEAVETALTSLTRTVSLPGQPLTQALDETGLLLMEGGKLSLNLPSLLDTV